MNTKQDDVKLLAEAYSKVEEGIGKSIRRGLKGWGPASTAEKISKFGVADFAIDQTPDFIQSEVKRMSDSKLLDMYNPEEAKRKDQSPRAFQHRVIRRELRRQGLDVPGEEPMSDKDKFVKHQTRRLREKTENSASLEERVEKLYNDIIYPKLAELFGSESDEDAKFVVQYLIDMLTQQLEFEEF